MEHILEGSAPFWILQFLQGMIQLRYPLNEEDLLTSESMSAIKEVNDWVPRNIKDIQAVWSIIKLFNAIDFINIDNKGN